MERTYEWYRRNGFDDRTARYFADGPRTISSVRPHPDYTLALVFDNGEQRILDCKRLFSPGSVFNSLRSTAAFSRVFLDENGNVAWDIDPSLDSAEHWDNRIDICKDACYLDSIPAASAPFPDIDIPPLSVAEPDPPPYS